MARRDHHAEREEVGYRYGRGQTRPKQDESGEERVTGQLAEKDEGEVRPRGRGRRRLQQPGEGEAAR